MSLLKVTVPLMLLENSVLVPQEPVVVEELQEFSSFHVPTRLPPHAATSAAQDEWLPLEQLKDKAMATTAMQRSIGPLCRVRGAARLGTVRDPNMVLHAFASIAWREADRGPAAIPAATRKREAVLAAQRAELRARLPKD
jgi:hypothetical protein